MLPAANAAGGSQALRAPLDTAFEVLRTE